MSFDILDPKLNVAKSTFLEASAGTGKTFTIEHLVLRLIEQGYLIENILAITFTREAASEMKERIGEKLASFNESLSFEELPIFTIHGFCHKMLTSFPFEAGFPLKTFGDFDHRDRLRKVTKKALLDSALSQHDLEILLSKARGSFERAVSQVAMAVESPQDEETVSSVDFSVFEKIEREKFLEDYSLLKPRYKRMTPHHFESQAQELAQWLENPATFNLEKLKNKSSFFLSHMEEGNTKIKAEPLGSLPLHYPQLIPELREMLVPAWKKLRDPNQALKRVASHCQIYWEEEKKAREAFSPDEILQAAKKACQNPSFARLVREKFRVVIVDEFQDTDPTQWDILETLFQAQNTLLYLVGDPKQSIYGFRRADVYTYMQAYKALGEGAKQTLSVNYRSSPALIEKLNALFSQKPDWIDLPDLPGSLLYHPVEAGRKQGDLSTPHPLTFFLAEETNARTKTYPSKQVEETVLFPYIASEIEKLSIPLGEIAILVKDRYQGQRLQHYLQKKGLPAQIKRTMSLTETRGFQAIKQLIEAACTPGDESLLKKVLLGPLCALTIEEDLSFKKAFIPLINTFREKGFASFFEEFMALPFVEKAIHTDPDFFGQAHQTAAILMQEKGDLLHVLSQLGRISPEEDPRLKLQAEAGEEQVAIMTLFASKGLEFTAVFALSLCCAGMLEEKEPNQMAEKMRQLYVAMTRAREKLYVPYLFTQAPTFSPIEHFFAHHTSDPIEFLKQLSIETVWAKGHSFSMSHFKNSESSLHPPEKILLPLYSSPLYSFSSLSEKSGTHIPKEPPENTLPLGAETGTLLHNIFERLFQTNQLSNPVSVVQQVLIDTPLEPWTEEVVEMVQKALSQPLINETSLGSLKPEDYFVEGEFLFQQEKKWIKGFADLVFHLEGKIYLLDWKTNWLESYEEEALRAEMQAHDYYLQARLYAEAIGRYVKQFYIDETPFGGAIYYFLRGGKALFFNPFSY